MFVTVLIWPMTAQLINIRGLQIGDRLAFQPIKRLQQTMLPIYRAPHLIEDAHARRQRITRELAIGIKLPLQSLQPYLPIRTCIGDDARNLLLAPDLKGLRILFGQCGPLIKIKGIVRRLLHARPLVSNWHLQAF